MTSNPATASPVDRPVHKKGRPSLHDKAIAEQARAEEAVERARVLREEHERYLSGLVGRIVRHAAKSDPAFREAMQAKLRAAKLTRREAGEIRHLINN